MVQFANSTRNDRNESAIDLSSSSPDDSVHDDSQPLPTDGDEKRSRKGKKRRRAKEAGAVEVNGSNRPSSRKNSLSKAARDPRDEPEKKVKRKKGDILVEWNELFTLWVAAVFIDCIVLITISLSDDSSKLLLVLYLKIFGPFFDEKIAIIEKDLGNLSTEEG